MFRELHRSTDAAGAFVMGPALTAMFCAVTVSFGLCVPAHAKASYTVFDAPGAINTIPTGISEGEIAGDFENPGAVYHGFVRAVDGTFTTFDPAGSISTFV